MSKIVYLLYKRLICARFQIFNQRINFAQIFDVVISKQIEFVNMRVY